MDLTNLKSIYKFVQNITTKQKVILLEPISVMVYLAILNFKTDGTKINIYNNKLHFSDPDYLQGISRYIYGTNRNDIQYLHNPILRCIHNYDIDNESIVSIFNFSIKGLKKLKKMYHKDCSEVIVHAIELYIYLIKSFLDGNKSEVVEKYKLNKSITYELNKIWKNEEIKIINDILLQCNDNNDNENYINAIKNIINTKHDEIENLNCNI
tara:strand:- start:569 stop:1198 length:630 start_codon:yes stop_codon:yes gene_type:complete